VGGAPALRGATPADRRADDGPGCDNCSMIKWLIATVIALALFSGLMPLLRRFGIGRLPGDFNFTLFGREISLPVMSTVLLSLMAAGISHLF